MVDAVSRGRRVAKSRVARGLSQEDLARYCECSARTIARIEAGECPAITLRLIEKLHTHLGIPTNDLGSAARRGKGA